MKLTLLKSKLHRAAVTSVERDYEGSLELDRALMDEAGLVPYERVEIFNITNGHRFSTYVMEGERGSRIIGIRGAASHLAKVGDRIIVVAYADLTPEEVTAHRPVVVILNESNDIVARRGLQTGGRGE